MPKGAPGQSRKPGGGRKPKQPGRQYERITVRISREAAKFINASGNASETIEKLAREKMEQQARERINEMRFTDEQVDFIFSDWPNWDEHMAWLLTATRDEIISWINASK